MQTFRFILFYFIYYYYYFLLLLLLFLALMNQDNDNLLSAHHRVERNEEPVEMEALDSDIEGKSAFYMPMVKERDLSRRGQCRRVTEPTTTETNGQAIDTQTRCNGA